LRASPDDPLALQGLAVVYILVGKISAAAPLCERLMQVDPLDFITNACQGLLHLYDGQFDYALQKMPRLYEMYPDIPYSSFWYALTLAYNDRLEEAYPIIDSLAKEDSSNAIARLGCMLKYALQKDKEKAFQEMTPDFQKTCQRDPTYCHHLAGIFAMLDAKDEALSWLENAVNSGFINYPLLAERDSFLKNLRREERFKKLMERVKYEWEHFEV
jgi:lipoprotein NlpI